MAEHNDEHLVLGELGAGVEWRARKADGWVVAYGATKRAWDSRVLCVVQDEVCSRVMEEKWARLERGERLALCALVDADESWLFDGHHSLAAALLSGRCEQLDVWEYRRGGIAVGTPRLTCRA
jgi:hypothetical protein